jgi:NAD-dependent DNA ligase
MTKEEIEALSEADAWKIIYSIRSKKAQDNRLQICFTGFGASRKQELSEIAERNNLKVVSSVTKNLDFLCGGENAGPKKVEKAELQGVQFLDELQFLNLIATGEIPNS